MLSNSDIITITIDRCKNITIMNFILIVNSVWSLGTKSTCEVMCVLIENIVSKSLRKDGCSQALLLFALFPAVIKFSLIVFSCCWPYLLVSVSSILTAYIHSHFRCRLLSVAEKQIIFKPCWWSQQFWCFCCYAKKVDSLVVILSLEWRWWFFSSNKQSRRFGPWTFISTNTNNTHKFTCSP